MLKLLSQLRTREDVRLTLDFLEDCRQAPASAFTTPFDNSAWHNSPVLSQRTFWADFLPHVLPADAYELQHQAIHFNPSNALSPASTSRLDTALKALRSRFLGVFWGDIGETLADGWAVDVCEPTRQGKTCIGRSRIDGGVHIGTVVVADGNCRISYGGECRILAGEKTQVLCKAPWCAFALQFQEAQDGHVPEGALGGGYEADQSELFIAVVKLRNGAKWVGKVRPGFEGCHVGVVKEECFAGYKVVMLRGSLRNAEGLEELRALLGRAVQKDMKTHGFFDTFKEFADYECGLERYEVATPKDPEKTSSVVLLCHDMKGGYCDDADAEYRSVFTSWNKIDMFCYFSHHFIAVPPRVWIDDCARNKTLCLGTIATEHKAGEKNSNLLLHSGHQEMVRSCRKLAQLCVQFGFHGWLVNFESMVQHHSDVIKFLKMLSMSCKEAIGPHARVVYYDSLDLQGRVRYQNCLNHNNKVYFDACDGIFTNYWFREEEVEASLVAAGEARARDVFFGVDVFARRTAYLPGPGCRSMTRYLSAQGASVAVFAPGWSLEAGPAGGKSLPEAQQADREFWDDLFPSK